MANPFQSLDRLLRGETGDANALREGRIDLPVGSTILTLAVLGAIYGLCMGAYALINNEAPELQQIVAAALKVPMLFMLTLAVTFPSLYVFNALMGSRLTAGSVARLIIAAIAIALAVLASFGPIVVFFSFTTKSYSFMIVLNVVVFGIAGLLGLRFMLQRLSMIHDAVDPPVAADAEEGTAHPKVANAADPVRVLFRIWTVVFGLVGVQMAWVMRPFIGDPDKPFSWFRPRESNFFESVWFHLTQMFT